MRLKHLWLKLLLAVVLSAVFVAIFASFDGFSDSLQRLRNADPFLISIALMMMILAQLGRAARLSVLVHGEAIPNIRLFSVSILHAFLASLLPMRIGELSLVLLLKHRHQMTMANGLGVLVGTKVLDFLFLLTVGCFSAAWLLREHDIDRVGLVILVIVIGFFGLLGFLSMPLSQRPLRAISRASEQRGWRQLAHFINELISSYSALTNRQVIALEVTTVLIWSLFLTSFHLCALAVNGTIGPIDTCAAAVAGSFAFALPVNGLAQFGPFEAAWVSAAHFLSDIDISRSLPAALLVHGATLVVSGLLALAMSLWLFREAANSSGV
jgi:uncharacterized protein (TIRG00374 family)